jgi:tripartite ATP-independent transporter DctM subunit
MAFFVCFLVLFIALALSIPIAFAVALAACIFMILQNLPTEMIIQQMYGGMNSYSLLALPLFVTIGTIMERGNISERLIDFASALVGHVRGGLGMVNVLDSMFFGGVSGSAVADVAATGSVIIPQMIKRGYAPGFAAALTSSTASIGIIIPPSIDMVIFGVLTGASVGTMFMAGYIPGILVGLTMMTVVYWMAKKKNFPTEGKFSLRRLIDTFKKGALTLLLPVIIIVGLISGAFTPTEAGAVAVVYGLFVIIVNKSFSWKGLYRILVDSAVMSAIVMILVGTSTLLGWVFAFEKVPQAIAKAVISISSDPTVILLMIAATLVVLGTFLHGAAMLVLVIPVMLPVIQAAGINLIHFGIICVFGVGVGQQTPPVGSTLFVASAISRCDIVEITRYNIPFILCLLGIMVLIVFVPDVCLLLPKLMGAVK